MSVAQERVSPLCWSGAVRGFKAEALLCVLWYSLVVPPALKSCKTVLWFFELGVAGVDRRSVEKFRERKKKNYNIKVKKITINE